MFQQLGVVDEVLASEPFTPSEYFGVDGQLIKRFTMVEPPYPLGFTPSIVFSQPAVERVLRAHVERLSTVEVALEARLTALSQDADGVTLHARTSDGRRREVRARYVIGCDGASSTVRELVGHRPRGPGLRRALAGRGRAGQRAGLAQLPAVSLQYCEPERPCTL